MILINCAMKQEEFKTFAEEFDESIHFVGKKGLALQFTSSDDKKLAAELKKALKADARFKALFFGVEAK